MQIHTNRMQKIGLLAITTCMIIAGLGGCAEKEGIRESADESVTVAGAEDVSLVENPKQETISTSADATMATTEPPASTNPYDFTICFAGDINLDENWCTTQFLNQQENGIYDCISAELIEHMNEADIMCLNNELLLDTFDTLDLHFYGDDEGKVLPIAE